MNNFLYLYTSYNSEFVRLIFNSNIYFTISNISTSKKKLFLIYKIKQNFKQNIKSLFRLRFFYN